MDSATKEQKGNLEKQLITATIAGVVLPKIAVEPELEPFYRRAAGLATTGKGGTINEFYDGFKRIAPSESDAVLLRKTLLDVGYLMEFMKEELVQLRDDFQSLNEEVVNCLETCKIED